MKPGLWPGFSSADSDSANVTVVAEIKWLNQQRRHDSSPEPFDDLFFGPLTFEPHLVSSCAICRGHIRALNLPLEMGSKLEGAFPFLIVSAGSDGSVEMLGEEDFFDFHLHFANYSALVISCPRG